MENKQSRESEGWSICSDLEDQLNLADFALDEFEAKSNDGTAVGEIATIKAELVEMKKEMEMKTMKLSKKADSNEVGSKLDGKIDRLEKYFDQKMVANETKIGNLDMEINGLKMGMENVKKMMEEKPNELMKEKLAKTEEAMAKLKEEIDQKDQKLAEHEAKIESLEEQLSSQDKILEKRGAKICTLIEEIGQKDEKIAEKNEEICALEEEMGQNEQQLDEKELKIYKLKYEIEQQDEKLTSEICACEREIGSLEEEIGQKDQKLEEKEAKICELEDENAYLKQKMEEKEAKIGALENETDGLKAKICQKEQQMEKKDEEICALKAKIGQKDQKLAEKEAKIGAVENEIAKQKKVMLDLQSIITNSKIDEHSPIDATNSSNAKSTKAPTTTTSSNLYGYCASCEQAFLQTDWARQVGDLQYHVDCFKCDHCHRKLLTFEEFGQDFKIQRKNLTLGQMVPRILCKKDYMDLVVQKKSTQVVNAVKVSDPGTKYPYIGSTWQIYEKNMLGLRN